MAIFIIILNKLQFNWVNLFELTAEVNLIVFIVSMFVPYNAWGNWFAGLFHFRKGTIAFKLVQGIIPSIFLNSFNTFICTGTSIFYNAEISKSVRMSVYISSCEKAWIPCFIVSYIASFAAVWLGSRVAKRYVE